MPASGELAVRERLQTPSQKSEYLAVGTPTAASATTNCSFSEDYGEVASMVYHIHYPEPDRRVHL